MKTNRSLYGGGTDITVTKAPAAASGGGGTSFGFRGTFGGTYDDTTAPTGSITDATVQSEIKKLISGGKVPAPDADTYYAVHFAPGVNVTASDGSRSCIQFCAYHGTFVRNGVNVNYGIVPDIGQSGCNGGCGGSTG